MSNGTELNPFAQVYTALWDLLNTRERIAELVKPRNQIRFDDDKDRDPMKDHVAVADVPELVLSSFGGTPNTHATSTSASILRTYQLMISTGDYRFGEGLYEVEWEVFSALTDWCSVVGQLTYKGDYFVKRADLIDLSEGVADVEANRALQGWSAIWTGQVLMYFNLKDLK